MELDDYYVIVRGAMSAVPALSSFATWWGEFEASKNFKRLELFNNSLKAITDRHSKEIDAIKNDTQSYEERVKILEITIEKVVKEWEDQKIELHAKLAVNNLISNAPLSQKMSILERFSELSMDDLTILRFLTGNNSVQVNEIRMDLNQIVPILSKLEARGLIAETGPGSRSMWTSATSSNWRDKWTYKFYTATPIGHALLKAIS